MIFLMLTKLNLNYFGVNKKISLYAQARGQINWFSDSLYGLELRKTIVHKLPIHIKYIKNHIAYEIEDFLWDETLFSGAFRRK